MSTPTLDMLYTRALGNPTRVRSRTDFVGQSSTRTTARVVPNQGPTARAVVIGWRKVQSDIAYLVVLLVLLSVGLGVIVGLATRNVEWGLGVTGTSIGVVAVLEVIVVWSFR